MDSTRSAWRLSALEFMVLWHAIGRDVLPYPLRYRSVEDTAADYEHAYKTAAARLRTIFDEDLYGPLRVLVQPEARIEIAGFAGAARPVLPRAAADPAAQVRMHAAVAGRGSVLLTQGSTADPGRGGDVRLEFVPAHTLARRVFAAFPEVARGSGPEIRLDRAEVDEPADRPFTAFSDDAPRPPHDAARRFFERPRSTVAHFAVYPGGAYDHRPAPARDFHLMDYPDGRYRVRATAKVHAAPADTGELATHLHELLERTLRDYREDQEL
ncbi:ESX secretion-associated protein EspG [Nocardia sp. NBC_01329]|uniref:ESX secretion-associated protein EspG n=1 Tax=Nocardia sp. NBC_01329 TaxID=2903594 RepID=UPI002E0E103E|nr:ESX secretion-associated protein EspG [Nocardia sp. NBC_01329]